MVQDPIAIVGPIKLPLRVDESIEYFSLHYFQFDQQRWVSVALGNLQAPEPLLLRIESACFFGHVLGSQQCDCGYQLREALRRIVKHGSGLLIYGVDHDARALGLETHFWIYHYRQVEHLDTEEIYRRLHAPFDSRDYNAITFILRHLDVKNVRLMSNNLNRLDFLAAQGFEVSREPLEAPLTQHNMATVMLEKEDLGHILSVKTHTEWLRPLQEKVEGSLDTYGARIVEDNKAIVVDWIGQDWDVARQIASLVKPGRSTDHHLVAYVTDLPRLDELLTYVSIGVKVIVIPLPIIPDYLEKESDRLKIKIQDWLRSNKYTMERPQWMLLKIENDEHVYKRGSHIRTLRVTT